jgi:hypothetical protein
MTLPILKLTKDEIQIRLLEKTLPYSLAQMRYGVKTAREWLRGYAHTSEVVVNSQDPKDTYINHTRSVYPFHFPTPAGAFAAREMGWNSRASKKKMKLADPAFNRAERSASLVLGVSAYPLFESAIGSRLSALTAEKAVRPVGSDAKPNRAEVDALVASTKSRDA